ncbi:MAG: hypothetical protein WA364_26555 [Candidatus Nitrosopolaris sp.]
MHIALAIYSKYDTSLKISPAGSIAKDGTIRLPFGSARTSPVSASDVTTVVSTILEDPTGHRGIVL